MIIREPLVHTTYYYLREAPGDTPSRRQDRYDAFIDDTRRMLHSITGWLAMPAPTLPPITRWDNMPPLEAAEVMHTGELHGQINAYAHMSAYVLRNMLLLRIIVSRPGEHDQGVWSMLEESLGQSPTTPSWLHTTRYWCGMAPRPPAEVEQNHLIPIQTPFGVLCLGEADISHVLVYPDARTEQRANIFLNSLAMKLDWHTVQARYRLESYENHAASAARTQRYALDQVDESMQEWTTPDGKNRLRTLAPLHSHLTTLETAYNHALTDLAATEQAAREMQNLAAGYRLALMESGLWDAAPTVWQSRIANLEMIHAQIDADLRYIQATTRRMEMLHQTLQTRVMLLNGERERLLVYVIAALGLAVLAVLIVDTSLAQIALRILALVEVGGLMWAGWQTWLRRQVP